MKKLPILIFIALCLTALATSYGSYRSAERAIEGDMRQALAKTIDEKGVETMRQDSIRAYKSMSYAEGETMTIAVGDETLRRHLREPRLRERAYITYTVGKEKGRWKVMFSTEARYSAAMIWNMSDQRLSLVLAFMALLSLAFSFQGRRQLQPVVMENFSDYISISYKLKNLTASLFCQNLFKRNGKIEEVENHNRLAHKLLVARNRNTSNAIGIKLAWTLSKGRKFKGIERDTDSLKDTETGVAKSGK